MEVSQAQLRFYAQQAKHYAQERQEADYRRQLTGGYVYRGTGASDPALDQLWEADQGRKAGQA